MASQAGKKRVFFWSLCVRKNSPSEPTAAGDGAWCIGICKYVLARPPHESTSHYRAIRRLDRRRERSLHVLTAKDEAAESRVLSPA